MSFLSKFSVKKSRFSIQLIFFLSIIVMTSINSMEKTTPWICRMNLYDKVARRLWEKIFYSCSLDWCKYVSMDSPVVRFNDAQEHIKTFMRCRSVCRYFNALLVDSRIIHCCERYRNSIGGIENDALRYMLNTLYKTVIDKQNSHLTYKSIRLPVLLLLYMASHVDDVAMDFLAEAVACNDIMFVDTILKCEHIQRKKETAGELFVYAQTIEMAQNLIDNDIDVHTAFSHSHTYLHPIIKAGSSLELMNFYINTQHVDIDNLAGTLRDGFCLLHNLVNYHYLSKDTIDKVKLLLCAQPDMVNVVDDKNRTALDLIALKLVELKKVEVVEKKHRRPSPTKLVELKKTELVRRKSTRKTRHDSTNNTSSYHTILEELVNILYIEYGGTCNTEATELQDDIKQNNCIIS